MTKKEQDVLYHIEKIVTKHDVILKDLKLHFENHLSHHVNDLREARRYHRALIIVAAGALLTAGGSLIVGLVLIG